eukprot:gene9831-biopygen16750
MVCSPIWTQGGLGARTTSVASRRLPLRRGVQKGETARPAHGPRPGRVPSFWHLNVLTTLRCCFVSTVFYRASRVRSAPAAVFPQVQVHGKSSHPRVQPALSGHKGDWVRGQRRMRLGGFHSVQGSHSYRFIG